MSIFRIITNETNNEVNNSEVETDLLVNLELKVKKIIYIICMLLIKKVNKNNERL